MVRSILLLLFIVLDVASSVHYIYFFFWHGLALVVDTFYGWSIARGPGSGDGLRRSHVLGFLGLVFILAYAVLCSWFV